MRRLFALMNSPDRPLDDGTAERMLRGSLSRDDAPPEYRVVVDALRQVVQPPPRDLTHESQAVAAITQRIVPSADAGGTGWARLGRRRITQLAAAGTLGAVSLFGGLAAANALPGAAQGVASDMLARVGVTVPGPNEHAGTHPDDRGASTNHAPSSDSVTTSDASDHSSNGQGATISDLAHTTTATGVDKGALISGVASDGQSQAGQHGQATTAGTPEGPPASTPPVSVPEGPPSGLPKGPPDSTPPVSTPHGPPPGVPSH